MALSPNIPTSFVPKTPVQTVVRPPSSGTNVLALIGTFLLVLAIVGAIGTFLYDRYLLGVITAKSEEITIAQNEINTDTIEDFVRLRNRFEASAKLLNDHVAVSQFFDLLEKSTLQNIRFESLTFVKQDDGTITVQMAGVAKSFNALAAESNAFAREPYIKSAIFSDINTQLNNTVTFSFDARLDPRLIQMNTPTAQELQGAVQGNVPTTTPVSLPATTTPGVSTTTRVLIPQEQTAPVATSTGQGTTFPQAPQLPNL